MGSESFIRRTILFLLTVLLCLGAHNAITAYAYTGNGDTIVHITKTGSCYHNGGCSALRSDIETTLEDAFIQGYQPCERCRPPIYTGEAVRNSVKEKSSGGGSGGGSGHTYSKSNTNASVNRTMVNPAGKNSRGITPLLFGLGGLLGIGIVAGSVKKEFARKQEIIFEQKEIIRQQRETIQQQQEQIQKQQEHLQRQKEQEERSRSFDEKLKGKSIQEIVGAPDDIVIKKDGTVIKGQATREKPYGELTVYISNTGKKYHKCNFCRNINGMVSANKLDVISKGYRACDLCIGKNELLPTWYKSIPRVIRALEE